MELTRADDDVISVQMPLAIRRRGPQLKLVIASKEQAASAPDRSLITAITRARDWAARVVAGTSMADLANEEQVTDSYFSQLLPLAYLAPSDIVVTVGLSASLQAPGSMKTFALAVY